jgi:phosphoglycerol transferase MdoB-like AlkP superfamily enzyme
VGIALDVSEQSARKAWVDRCKASALSLLFAAALSLQQLALLGTSHLKTSAGGFVLTVGSSLFLGSLPLLAPRRARFAVLLAIDLVLSAAMTLDLVLLSSNGIIANWLVVAEICWTFGQISVSSAWLKSLSLAQVLLLWGQLPLLAWVAFRHRPQGGPRPGLGLALGAAGLGSLILAVPLDPFWVTANWRATAAVSHAGFLGDHLLNLGADLTELVHKKSESRRPSPKSSQSLLNWAMSRRRHAPAPGGSTHAAQIRNVIVIQFESLQGFVLGLKVGGEEVTPNLNRLASDSVVFDHFFSQVGNGNTSDAEWLSLCSQYPAVRVAFLDYEDRYLKCLPSLARAAGAHAVAVHGNNLEFWNRAQMWRSMGFERLVGNDAFAGAPVIGLGTADAEVVPAAFRLATAAEPFFLHVVTLSSHRSYDGIPLRFPSGGHPDTVLDKYLEAVHYSDAAIGAALAELNRAGLSGRTAIVVYGDHAGVRRDDSGVREFLHKRDSTNWYLVERRVPLIVHAPGLQPHLESRLAGQIDVAPTIANLVGYPAIGEVFFGRDLLSPNRDGLVAFYDGSALDDRRRYLPFLAASHRCRDRLTSAELPDAECKELASRSRAEVERSRDIIEKNLLFALPPEKPAAAPLPAAGLTRASLPR